MSTARRERGPSLRGRDLVRVRGAALRFPRMGRPAKIDQVIRHNEAGSPVTAGEHLIERVGLGLALTSASAEAGISRETFRTWRLRGARARADLANGRPVEPRDLPFVDWLDRLEAAEEAAELRYLTVVDNAASQDQQVRKVVIKREMRDVTDAQSGQTRREMVEVERTETVEIHGPDWQAAKWRLQTMKPGRYTIRPEVAEGESSTSREERAERLAAEFRAYLDGREEAALEGPVMVPDPDDIGE